MFSSPFLVTAAVRESFVRSCCRREFSFSIFPVLGNCGVSSDSFGRRQDSGSDLGACGPSVRDGVGRQVS